DRDDAGERHGEHTDVDGRETADEDGHDEGRHGDPGEAHVRGSIRDGTRSMRATAAGAKASRRGRPIVLEVGLLMDAVSPVKAPLPELCYAPVSLPRSRRRSVVGGTVGPYQVLARLGAGGMGEVFLGHDPRLQRRVALKCLN